MNRSMLAALALVVTLMAPVGLASHQGNYAFNPVEHDDQGTSTEPDAAATGVLGTPLVNTVIDRNFDHFADVPTPPKVTGKSDVLAPGCTNAAGTRVSSGQCGIWTVGVGVGLVGNVVPPKTADIPGFTVKQGNCPGRYGGGQQVFLDARVDLGVIASGAAAQIINLNHKVSDLDSTTGGLLSQLGIKPFLLGPQMTWAWYGRWTDLNCNGVIDHLQTDIADPSVVDLDNEFVWYGACSEFDGSFHPEVIAGGYCAEDPNPNSNPPGKVGGNAATTMVSYIWPGQHDPNSLPDIDNMFAHEPDNVTADLGGFDRSGEPSLVDREWVLGGGFPPWFYDQSLILTTYQVTGVNCKPNPDTLQAFDLGATGGPGSPCTFLDVDRYDTWSPLLEPIVFGLHSTLNDAWTTINDLIPGGDDFGPISRLLNQVLGYDFYQNTLGPQQGLVNDLLLHPGWSREPNVGPTQIGGGPLVQDAYVQVRHANTCNKNPGIDDRDEAFFGWCNYNTGGNPVAYAAYRDEFRGFLDTRPQQVIFYVPIVDLVEGGTCIQCLGGLQQPFPTDAFPLPDSHPADGSDHTLTLNPGQYYWQVFMGRWRDQPNSVDESVFPNPAAAVGCDEDPSQPQCHTYPMDGWIGFVSGGSQDYQGYPHETCVTDQPPLLGDGRHTWAECHPYADGNADDPQGYGDAVEWEDACQLSSIDEVQFWPFDGTWNVPAVVWDNYETSVHVVGSQPTLHIKLPGDTGPLRLRMSNCTGGFGSTTVDHIFLPEGNVGETIVTVFSADVGVTIGGTPTTDQVTDVDVYGHAVI